MEKDMLDLRALQGGGSGVRGPMTSSPATVLYCSLTGYPCWKNLLPWDWMGLGSGLLEAGWALTRSGKELV